jgi:hypothetical protein
MAARSPMKTPWPAFASCRFPPSMRMYGFAHDKTVICKRSAVMHAVESSTATIRVGAKCRDEGAAVGERLPLPYDIVSMIACNTLRTSQRRRPGVARAFSILVPGERCRASLFRHFAQPPDSLVSLISAGDFTPSECPAPASACGHGCARTLHGRECRKPSKRRASRPHSHRS